jgi:hypothetical protein
MRADTLCIHHPFRNHDTAHCDAMYSKRMKVALEHITDFDQATKPVRAVLFSTLTPYGLFQFQHENLMYVYVALLRRQDAGATLCKFYSLQKGINHQSR